MPSGKVVAKKNTAKTYSAAGGEHDHYVMRVAAGRRHPDGLLPDGGMGGNGHSVVELLARGLPMVVPGHDVIVKGAEMQKAYITFGSRTIHPRQLYPRTPVNSTQIPSAIAGVDH